MFEYLSLKSGVLYKLILNTIFVYRADDYNDPIHLERISTLNMFETRDLGAIPTGKI